MIGELYLGTSPGFRRTHARRAGQSDVYSVAVNTYDLPDSTEGWLDKSLLQVTEVAAVQIDGKPLSKDGDNWVFDGSDQTDQEQASELVRSFENLRVLDVVEEVEESAEFSTVSVTSDNDGYEYRFGETDGSYLVARSDVDATFSISQATYDKIINAELLLRESEESETNSADQSAEEQADAISATDKPATEALNGSSLNAKEPTTTD